MTTQSILARKSFLRTNLTRVTPVSPTIQSHGRSVTISLSVSALTLPASTTNVSFWADSAVVLTRTNDTHRYEVEGGFVEEIVVQQPEYYFDWSTLASTSIAGQGFPYETALPSYYTDLSVTFCGVQHYQPVINDASAVRTYDQALALTFLKDGNASTEFKLNLMGLGSSMAKTWHNTCLKSQMRVLVPIYVNICDHGACYWATCSIGEWIQGWRLDWKRLLLALNTYVPGRKWIQQTSSAGGLDFGWVPFDTMSRCG